MARKRMIDPHIWEDPSFNRLSFGARILFIGMISNADDEGYLRGDTGSLKRLVFGFDEITKKQMQDFLQELAEIKTLHFYVSDDEEYVHFKKWFDYQKQKTDRIQASMYPKCPICTNNVGQVPDNVGQVPAEVKLSKEKLSNIPAAKMQRVAKCPNKTEGHTGCIEFIDSFAESRSIKFPNYAKQIGALHKMLSAKYTFTQINKKIDSMEKAKFWIENGFDLMNVANEIGKKNV